MGIHHITMEKQYRGKNSTCIIDIRQVGEIRWILKKINEFCDLSLKLQETRVITSLLKWKEHVLETHKKQDSKTAQGSHVSSQE